jgi:hypothetical protein
MRRAMMMKIFAGGHKKSAATLKHKMERSEILAG